MDSHKPEIKDEMKAFLQDGLHTYAPALVALSEFRRQVQSRLRDVLDDASRELSRLGLPAADLKLVGTKLDDSNSEDPWIGLRKNHGSELISGYYVQWNLKEPRDEQVWVAAEIYVGIRADRDKLFRALQEHRSGLSRICLEQVSDGSSCLYCYCDPDQFYRFEEVFRTVIEEWVRLLSAIGGVRPFLSASAASLIRQDREEIPGTMGA